MMYCYVPFLAIDNQRMAMYPKCKFGVQWRIHNYEAKALQTDRCLFGAPLLFY
jgi:hypothetical protein